MMKLHEILNKYITAPNDTSKDPVSGSSIGYCLRRLGYRLAGYPESQSNERLIMALHDGTALHESVRKDVRNALRGSCYRLSGVERECSITFNGMKITGHIDGILLHKARCRIGEHKTRLLEFKSASDWSFKQIAGGGEIPQRITLQVIFYSVATGIPCATILFKNKNSGEFYSVDMDVASPERETLFTRLEIISQMAKTRDYSLGRREFPKGSHECLTCPFNKVCWEEGG